MEYELNILYYINILKKYYRKILFLIVLAASIALIDGSLKKPIYTSRCSILLLESSSGTSVSSFGKFFGIPGVSFSSSSANIIISVVKSRKMLEDIYSNFKELKKNLNFNLKLEVYDTTQGTLIIEVKGRDPKLVSEIANFCVKNLDVINAELDITPQRPMAKVLDPAIAATRPDSKHIPKRIGIATIFAFFIGNLIFFGLEYYKALTITKK